MKDQFKCVITDKGGLVMQGPSFKEFLKKNKGKQGVVSITLYDLKDKKKIVGFYFRYIVPEFIKAVKIHEGLNITERLADVRLWNECIITRDKKHDIHSLEMNDICLYIEEIKYILANNYNYYISE